MALNLPILEQGRIYHRAEVEAYLGKQGSTSNYDVVEIHFPRSLRTWDHDGQAWRDGEEMLLQYQVIPMTEFSKQILDLEATFVQDEENRRRIEVIVGILLGGDPVYPVFLQQNDPHLRIIEGMHRAVALLRLKSEWLPAFLTGYRNWFTPDELLPGFVNEDEISTATLRDVYGFFMKATRIDHKGIQLALFDSDRLVQCDEALVAKYQDKVIGAVTMTVAKGKPALSTVYVLRQFRRKGVACRLCEKALLRFKEAGIQAVFCDVQSPGMAATLERLARERPDLRVLVREQIGYLPGNDIEMGLGDE